MNATKKTTKQQNNAIGLKTLERIQQQLTAQAINKITPAIAANNAKQIDNVMRETFTQSYQAGGIWQGLTLLGINWPKASTNPENTKELEMLALHHGITWQHTDKKTKKGLTAQANASIASILPQAALPPSARPGLEARASVYAVRAATQQGIADVAENSRAIDANNQSTELNKTWVRLADRAEHRSHHDDLIGQTIPYSQKFKLVTPKNSVLEIHRPYDDSLPIGEKIRCGHGIQVNAPENAKTKIWTGGPSQTEKPKTKNQQNIEHDILAFANSIKEKILTTDTKTDIENLITELNQKITEYSSKTTKPKKTILQLGAKTQAEYQQSPSNVLYKKLEEAKGSNPGGTYLGRDGVKRYVKFYENQNQAQGERLANEILNQLGLKAPDSIIGETVVGEKTKPFIANTIIENIGMIGETTKNLAGPSAALAAKEILRGFVADVLIANWDAVGLNYDNIIQITELANNKLNLARIDQGGSFLFRAQGGLKKKILLNQIDEWEGMQNTTINPSYARVFKIAGINPETHPAFFATQIKDILELEKKFGGWQRFVEQTVPTMPKATSETIIKMLNAKTKLLTDKLQALETQVRPIKKKGTLKQVIATIDDFRPWQAKISQAHGQENKKALLAELVLPFHEAAAKQINNKLAGGELRRRIAEGIQGWTSGYGEDSLQKQTYERILEFYKHSKLETNAFADVAINTREARLQAMLENAGVGDTTHFKLYRGVKDRPQLFIGDVLHGWFTGKTRGEIRQYAAASWTFDFNATKKFATDSLSVIFEADVPIKQTLADIFTDDSDFVTPYIREVEAIAMVNEESKMIGNNRKHIIIINSKAYRYKDRHAALEAYREIEPNFDPITERPKNKPTPDE